MCYELFEEAVVQSMTCVLLLGSIISRQTDELVRRYGGTIVSEDS